MKNFKDKKGFTLVETLVAIAILSLAVSATFTAAQNGLQTSSFAGDQITAFYLAQEAVEHVKNIRDENALWSLNSVSSGGAPRSWLTSLTAVSTDPCYFSNTCTIDVPAKTYSRCSGDWTSCPFIRRQSSSSIWGYNGAYSATSFRREIQFQNISANEVMITVHVSWTSGTFSKTISVTENIFNRY